MNITERYENNAKKCLSIAIGVDYTELTIDCLDSCVDTYLNCVRIATKYDQPAPPIDVVANIWKSLYSETLSQYTK